MELCDSFCDSLDSAVGNPVALGSRIDASFPAPGSPGGRFCGGGRGLCTTGNGAGWRQHLSGGRGVMITVGSSFKGLIRHQRWE